MFKFRPSKKKKDKREPKPCCDCGSPGAYGIDVFGVRSDLWRCRECHERACAAHIRNETKVRFG